MKGRKTNMLNCFKKHKNNKPKQQREKYLNYKKEIDKQTNPREKLITVNYITATIINYLNFYKAIQTFESLEKIEGYLSIEEVYNELEKQLTNNEHSYTIIDTIHPDDEKNYKNLTIINEEPINIKINEIPILVNVWKNQRIIENLKNINKNNVFNGQKYKYNIENHYLYPMNIIICHGGNHSQFSAIIDNAGDTIIKQIHDYSNLYDLIEFNGNDFIKCKDKTILTLSYNKKIIFYAGLLFELGRYILEYDYSNEQIKNWRNQQTNKNNV